MLNNSPSASIGWIGNAYLRRVCSERRVATTSPAALLLATGAPDIGAAKLRVAANTIATMNCIITSNLVTAGVKCIKRQMKYEGAEGCRRRLTSQEMRQINSSEEREEIYERAELE